MRLKRSGVLGVAAVSAALVLSGCTDSDGTTTEPTEAAPTTSTAPETSASPTPKPATSTSPAENIEPPVMPEEAKEFTAEGYEAFVNYWFEARDYALETGDTSILPPLSGEDCRHCEMTIKMIDDVSSKNQWIVGGAMDVGDFYTPFKKDQDGSIHSVIKIAQNPGKAYSSDGPVTEDDTDFQVFDAAFEFKAVYSDASGWVATSIEMIQ
ncbi:hypothetical protein GCM10022377_16870 [Zhihengliuella alba]|uniref:DUF6318 domain-containing protein n=1 Tax=Zhihengliuella alba TaxID=547018 RepID=A0ABP7DCP7_9MICC